jgi:hypothetical protein
MFDLRCSEFELFCSKWQVNHLVQDKGRRFKSSVVPLVAGVDLNHRPLGYELA